MKAQAEKPNFEKIHCFECDRPVREYYVIFFLGKEGGLPRYGAICEKCLKRVKSRKLVILSGNDVLAKSEDVAKKALKAFKRNM
ncbi:hypothetical protein DRO91_07965 [Candidatus Heimdallarchaeota archaeon]|nr:MAG: hypothetical protein DRO91_07965 [Candidatus Heimdallarchaeota archaeon]